MNRNQPVEDEMVYGEYDVDEELSEDLQDYDECTKEPVDLAKLRIAQLDEERAERVAKRRQPSNPIKRALHRIIPYGGIVSSGFNLASSSLGSGIIALPYAFNTSGLAMAIIYLVMVGLLTIYSFRMMGIAGKRTGLRNYEQVTAMILGRFAGYFLAFVMLLLSFGAEVSYVISMGDLIGAFVNNSDAPAYLKTTSGRRVLTAAVWLVAMLPPCLPKEVNSLRHLSVIAVLCIVFFVICMVIHSARNGLAHGPRKDLVYFQTGNAGIEGLSIFTFAFISQMNCYEVYEEMYKPGVNRLTKSAAVGVFLGFCLYFSAGLFGYLDFGPAVTGSVLKQYNPIEDKMMAVAYAGIIWKLCVGYGLHMIPVRDAVYHFLHIDVKKLAWWKNAMICTFMATCSLVAGFFIPNVNVVFGLVGGFCGGFMAFIIPALLYMYSGHWSLQSVGFFNYFATYFLLIVGVIAVVFGTAAAVYGEVQRH
ncbi:amino acid permease [Trypanosoma theileri]|uniref:Amino acid permease n=1 Tax=Trypanosoma theileri TaxID=67003 RepID=A0A1X0NKS5_9TRYP|nr:amino acid permease [Trypanosoma theileri]ORC84759.1 amino acid permease [Trypanosoma theileri]